MKWCEKIAQKYGGANISWGGEHPPFRDAEEEQLTAPIPRVRHVRTGDDRRRAVGVEKIDAIIIIARTIPGGGGVGGGGIIIIILLLLLLAI